MDGGVFSFRKVQATVSPWPNVKDTLPLSRSTTTAAVPQSMLSSDHPAASASVNE